MRARDCKFSFINQSEHFISFCSQPETPATLKHTAHSVFWDLLNNAWTNIDVTFKNRSGVGFFFTMLRQEIFNSV